MKKFLFLLLALVLSVSVSCSDDKTGDTGGSMLSVTPTEIEFEAAGGSRLLDRPGLRSGRRHRDTGR